MIGIQSDMALNGWKFDLSNDGSVQSDIYKKVGEKCKNKAKWYGWSSHALVRTLSTVLNGSGEATLDFGNCWNDGNVKVYMDSKLIATASEGTLSVIKSFSFAPGSLLEIKDEDGNAVMMLNSITFSCSGMACLILIAINLFF